MKPTVKVWPLPRLTQTQFDELFQMIVGVAKDMPGLGVKNESDIMVHFPADMMDYGLGPELVIEICLSSTARAAVGIGIARDLRRTVIEFYVSHGWNPPTVQAQITTIIYSETIDE